MEQQLKPGRRHASTSRMMVTKWRVPCVGGPALRRTDPPGRLLRDQVGLISIEYAEPNWVGKYYRTGLLVHAQSELRLVAGSVKE